MNIKKYYKANYPTLSHFYDDKSKTFSFTHAEYTHMESEVLGFLAIEANDISTWALIYNPITNLFKLEPHIYTTDDYELGDTYTFKIESKDL